MRIESEVDLGGGEGKEESRSFKSNMVICSSSEVVEVEVESEGSV